MSKIKIYAKPIFLIKPSGSNIIDVYNNCTITNYGVTVEEQTSPIGSAQCMHSGSGFKMLVLNNVPNVLNHDMTLSTWAKVSSVNLDRWDAIITQFNNINIASNTQYSIYVNRVSQSNLTGLGYNCDVGSGYTTYKSVVDNSWHHLAFTRTNNTIYGFVDGKLVGTGNAPDTMSSNISLWHLYGTNSKEESGYDRYVEGYHDDTMLIDGAALWTKDFTPPTAPLNQLYEFSDTPISIKKLKQY
jgi:hypothetical protein